VNGLKDSEQIVLEKHRAPRQC